MPAQPQFAPTLTADEKVACEHISRLFLAAQNTPEDIESIADKLSPLNLSVEALDNILRQDLFPILLSNPFSFEGAWISFDNQQLWNEVGEERARSAGLLKRGWDALMWSTVGWAFADEWRQVKEKLLRKRQERNELEEGSMADCTGPEVG